MPLVCTSLLRHDCGPAAVAGAVTLIAGEPFAVPTQTQTWLAVGYVSVIGSVGVFTLFLHVIARWSASATSYAMLLIPLVTVSLGAVLDHEAVTWAYLVGGPMVLAGVYVGVFAPPIRLGARAPTAAMASATDPASFES